MKSRNAVRFPIVLFILAFIILPTLREATGSGGYYNPTPTGVVVPRQADFHSYATLESELLGINASQPNLASLKIIGTSIENRSIYALRVTEGGGNKPNVWFDGLHESNEWMSLEETIYLVHYFLANANVNPRVDNILRKANVWFIPLVNPDGYEYSRVHDNLWRKNRHDNGDGTFGVDLNRNYAYEWAPGGRTYLSDNLEYPGPAPFSEPESQAMRDFAIANPPVFSLSYHTAGGWILFPWSYTPQPSSSDGLFRGIALEMSAFNGYKLLQEGRSNHVKPGNADDWLYKKFGTLAYTVELGPAFSSQDNNQIDAVLTSNIEPALLGTELSLGLKPLNCVPKQFLCVPVLSVVTVGIPMLIGGLFFSFRIIKRRREHQKEEMFSGTHGSTQKSSNSDT